MASATTKEFVMTSSRRDVPPFSVIEQKGLIARLVEELARTASEINRDPRGFMRDLLSNDTKDARRRRRIYAGLACALTVHVALLVFIAYVGWHSAFVKSSDEPEYEVKMLDIPKAHTDVPDPAKPEVPRGERGGGGSGGDHNPMPATKGPLPQMSPAPQIVKPGAPAAPVPPIAILPTIVGPDSARPPVDVALGIPTGPVAEAPSPGPGDGGGLGGRDGSGAGNRGNGPGGGNGNGGGKGDKGDPGLPGGKEAATKGPIDWNRLREMPGNTPFTWIHRPTPVITPEAQANRVVGEVLLRATFRENGTVTDISLIRTDVPEMIESAIESLRRSTFRPATVNGEAVTVRNVPVRVKIHY
jgi:TonB family protein